MSDLVNLASRAGFPVQLSAATLGLEFGSGVATRPPLQRRVADIRASLLDHEATGPDPLYCTWFDVRPPAFAPLMADHGLELGVVVDSPGTIGRELVRGQGHTHSSPPGAHLPYSELFEFWHGRGLLYLQNLAEPEVDVVLLVEARPGDAVLVPPGWVHFVANRGPGPLVFGALYASACQLVYEPVRALGGPAYFPLADGSLARNPRYRRLPPPRKFTASQLPIGDLAPGTPMLEALAAAPEALAFLTDPDGAQPLWASFQRAIEFSQ